MQPGTSFLSASRMISRHCACADADSSHTDDPASGDKPSKAKKQKQKGAYAPQRLLSAVCKVAPHFKVPIVRLCHLSILMSWLGRLMPAMGSSHVLSV